VRQTEAAAFDGNEEQDAARHPDGAADEAPPCDNEILVMQDECLSVSNVHRRHHRASLIVQRTT